MDAVRRLMSRGGQGDDSASQPPTPAASSPTKAASSPSTDWVFLEGAAISRDGPSAFKVQRRHVGRGCLRAAICMRLHCFAPCCSNVQDRPGSASPQPVGLPARPQLPRLGSLGSSSKASSDKPTSPRAEAVRCVPGSAPYTAVAAVSKTNVGTWDCRMQPTACRKQAGQPKVILLSRRAACTSDCATTPAGAGPQAMPPRATLCLLCACYCCCCRSKVLEELEQGPVLG